jgi:hypothetical protein
MGMLTETEKADLLGLLTEKHSAELTVGKLVDCLVLATVEKKEITSEWLMVENLADNLVATKVALLDK